MSLFPTEAAVLNRNILHVLPQISEANVMAEELKKDVKYDTQLLTPEMQGKLDGQTEVSAKFHRCILLYYDEMQIVL